MTISNQNAKIYRGDTVTLFVALTQADGTPYDSSINTVMKWRMLNNAYDDESLSVAKKDLGSGIVSVTSPAKGVNISLLSSDTNLDPGFYYHQLVIWDGPDQTTAMVGLIILKRAVLMVKAGIIAPASRTIMLSGSVPIKTP